ncbi:MAG TPA: Xaa-Pro peptidase family protein, partial [Actinomycetota bacterium]|nr:Xaa-Pro peptidase family protein [Actinomycetota bacterium]
MDHALRRERLAAELRARGLDALLVTRLPNVRYLTGFTGSNGQVVVAAEGRAVLLTDGRYEGQAAREAPDLERRVSRDGALAPAALEAARALGAARLAFEATLAYREARELEERADGLEVRAAEGVVERLRWEKDPDELRALERAQELTDLAFERLPGLLREGVSEREVGLELEVAVRRAGAEALAFDPIVAFGEHAAEPHHRPCDRSLRRGDVVKVDLGARASGYHADMTRTLAFGEPPAELHDLHALVARAQAAGLAALRAGATAGEVDAAARGVIAGAGLGERFPHGLGHGVGLEIHEGPWLRPGGAEPVPAGAVVTVEPGVYVPGLGG